ncbi:hypothetical protein C7212DRAFT_356725 [Tuber magnatum]|uniref:Uncharacterized protein n=1 Tax=Tuber magnatum TaxID=42249 RepID=A0A317STW4_9PEZI|nr:hypothetical protein C7212DRAFT_356725 [Tuber magnatum]
MENQQSNAHLEDLSLPQRANSHSNNTTNSYNNNTYCNTLGRSSTQNFAEIMQCLYTSRYVEHRGRVREPVEGTCTWVTEHPKYKRWLEERPSGLLWISADPGCGKSVIASFLVAHLKMPKDAVVCYFFFKDDNAEQRSATFALCAILHQLFSERTYLCRYAEEEFNARGKRFAEEVDTLWNILVKSVTDEGCGDLICVLDGLDECEKKTRAQLLPRLTRLAESGDSNPPLKFLVTGRPYHEIRKELDSRATTIRLKGEEEVNAITTDVNRVIDDGIRELESVWESPAELEYLGNLLKSSADRTFLWVSLVLEILKDCEGGSRNEFTNIVTTASRDLAGFYTKILDKSAQPDQARRVLHIVVAAARPLTLAEMNIAFTIRQHHKSMGDIRGGLYTGFEQEVKNLCGLFVRIIDSKIYLVHQTAREFLIKGAFRGQGKWQYTLRAVDSSFLMANICITYLALQDFEHDPLPMDALDTPRSARKEAVQIYVRKYAFLDYAASHWAGHFRDSQRRQMRLFGLTRLICKGGSNRFLTWLKVYWENNVPYYPFPNDFTHLMIASWLGQQGVVSRLLKEERDISAHCKQYGTILNIAALRKEKDLTEMLVKRNVNAYLQGKEYTISRVKRPPAVKWLVLS